MFTPQLTIPQWLSLQMPIRLRLKSIFNIPRSSGSEVVNTTVLSDGHTHGDLAVITVEKMQQYLSSDEQDFYKLLVQVVDSFVDLLLAACRGSPAAFVELAVVVPLPSLASLTLHSSLPA